MSGAVLEQVRRGEAITACEVIDCHGHVGPLPAFHSADMDPAGMLTTMDRLGIRRIAISSCPSIFAGDPRPGNDLTARVVRGRVLTISCIDNLIKGASGAAVQNFNLMYGYPETTAL